MLELLTGIVVILVAVFVVRRLLGIDRGRWLITVGAVLAGEAAATAIVTAVYGGVSEVPAAGLVAGWALVTIFAMLVVVLVELLTGSRARGRLRGVPRPIRQLRLMTRRSCATSRWPALSCVADYCAPGAAPTASWADRGWVDRCD